MSFQVKSGNDNQCQLDANQIDKMHISEQWKYHIENVSKLGME